MPNPCISKNLEWGDFHFAYSLARSFRSMGYKVRIDTLSYWYYKRPIEEKYTLNLRGLSEYIPNSDKVNLIWLISHPEKLTLQNLSLYSHIFVASETFLLKLRNIFGERGIYTKKNV